MKKRNLIIKLKPFWKKYLKLQEEFYEKEYKLKKKINKKIKSKVKLEFFKVDGECCGIGAENFEDRKEFPLVSDNELGF